MTRWFGLLVIVAAMGVSMLWTLEGWAAPGPTRPKRLVHFFNFEERAQGNAEDLPMHWYAIGRPAQNADPNFQRQPLHETLIRQPGFPAFTAVRFDQRHAVSGTHSFHLGINGGSAGAFLQVGTLPAIPGSDYLVAAKVRTEQVKQARAQITAYFVDARGRRLAQSLASVTNIQTQGQWIDVTLKLDGVHRDAAWIGLEVALVQPGPTPGSPLGTQQVILEDVAGEAWFDDIGIWQLPHVEVSSQSPINVIAAPQRPQVVATVKDLAGRQMMAQTTLYDHRLRQVARERRPVGRGHPTQWSWTPALPGYGWYLIDLRVSETAGRGNARQEIARTVGAVLWLPDESAMPQDDATRFVLDAQGITPSVLPMLEEMLDRTGLRSVVLSVWDSETTLANLPDRQTLLDDAIHRVLGRGGEVILSLSPVPTALARHVGTEAAQALGVMARDPDRGLAFLDPVLRQHGQRVAHWQLGMAPDADAFFYDNLPDRLAAIQEQVGGMVAHPRLHVPWRLAQSRDPGLPDSAVMAMDVSLGIEPAHLAAHLKEWQDQPQAVYLHLQPHAADRLSHPQRVADLALRMVYGWEQNVAGMVIATPWADAMLRTQAIVPDPLLGVYTNVAHRLADRRVVGRLNRRDGTVCLIFDGPPGGMLVAWNRRAPQGQATLDMVLGDNPVIVDVWGNRTTPTMYAGKHHVPLTHQPVFIEGIDPKLALFRAGFVLNEPFLESRQVPHDRTLTLTNPWPQTLSGSLSILGPEGWTIQPSQQFFSIAAGQSTTLPVHLVFPASEVAGPKQLSARFDFTADRPYVVDVSTPMRLGLTDVDFDATLALEPGQSPGTEDAILACVVTNKSDRPQSWYLFAHLPGHERINRPISQLEPGETVVRRLRLTNVRQALDQYPLRAGVREVNGPAVFNKAFTLADAQLQSR